MKKITNEHPATQDSKVDLQEYWRILWRRKIMLAIPIVASVAVTVIGFRFIEPLYRSSTVIRVEDKELLNSDVIRMMQTQGARTSIEQDQKTLAKIDAAVKGSDFQELLIDRLGLGNDPDLIQEAQQVISADNLPLTVQEYVYLELRSRLAKKTEIKYEGPGMFRISFVDQSPDVAFVVAGTMASLFVEMEERKELQGLQDMGEFSDEQLAVYKARLEQSEKELEEFKRSETEKDLESNPVNEGNIRIAESLAQQLTIQINDMNGIIENMRSNLDRLLPDEPPYDAVIRDPRVLDLQKNLVLKREAQLLLQLKGDNASPDRVRVEDGIKEVEGGLQRYLATFAKVTAPEIDRDYLPLFVEACFQMVTLKSWEEKWKSGKLYIRAYKEKLALGPQYERKLRRLQEEVNTNRDLYQSFLRAKATTQISEAAHSTAMGLTVEIVEPAARPLLPHSPKKAKILIIATLFGGFIGLSGLVLTEYSDSSYRNTDEIEKDLGLRVLGTVPQLTPGKTWKREGNKGRMIVWGIVWSVIIVLTMSCFYFYGKVSAKHALQFNNARVVGDQ